MMRSVLFLAAALTLAATARVDGTTALKPLTIPELADRSGLIIHGTIRSIRSELVAGRGIFTRIEVVPLEVLKGNVADETVNLWVYGGSSGDLRTIVEGWPCMDKDEEVVLFLAANGPRTHDLVNLAEGKFSVQRTDAAPATVSRDLRGIAYLDLSTPITIPTELAELEAAIRTAGR